MKKILSISLTFIVLFGSSLAYSQSFDDVLDWMYDNGLTKFNTTDSFRPDDFVTRGEISKFFSNFAQLQGLEISKEESECSFNDIASYDYTLRPTIIQACQYGLVKGHEGNYYPNSLLTEAEALTVIVRSILGFQDETVVPRWKEYYEIGKWLNIIDNEGLYDLEKSITRAKVGTRLYRAAQIDEEEVKTEGTEELKAILEDIFGEDFWE